MMAYPGQTLTWTQCWANCAPPYGTPNVIQPGIDPGSVVMTLALICSALHCCATREPKSVPD
jgi:hypothetical protein